MQGYEKQENYLLQIIAMLRKIVNHPSLFYDFISKHKDRFSKQLLNKVTNLPNSKLTL